MFEAPFWIGVYERYDAVSYTHLNQASTDRIELAKLLNISDLQMSYITNVGAGQGLLKVGSSLVPVSYTHLNVKKMNEKLFQTRDNRNE